MDLKVFWVKSIHCLQRISSPLILITLRINISHKKQTCMITCLPSMAPMQWTKFVISSKSCAISNHSISVNIGGKTSGCKIAQIALHVSLIMLLVVLSPTRYWYDIDVIESPDARYLKY